MTMTARAVNGRQTPIPDGYPGGSTDRAKGAASCDNNYYLQAFGDATRLTRTPLPRAPQGSPGVLSRHHVEENKKERSGQTHGRRRATDKQTRETKEGKQQRKTETRRQQRQRHIRQAAGPETWPEGQQRKPTRPTASARQTERTRRRTRDARAASERSRGRTISISDTLGPQGPPGTEILTK